MKNLLLSLVFFIAILPAHARAQREELRETLRSLSYSLTVEWDQRDPSFLRNTLDNFRSDIARLVSEGTTREDFLAAVTADWQETASMRDAELLFRSLGNEELSSEEILEVIREKALGLQTKGAAWNGSGGSSNMVFLFFLAAGAIVIATAG